MTLLDMIEGANTKVLCPSGGCHNCPLRTRNEPNAMRDGQGRIDFVPATLKAGRVLFIGEGPGATEVAQQEGFVGKAGELLRRWLEHAKVPKPWSFSNTVHCRPPENRTPAPKEVSACMSQFVLSEIDNYQYIVLVGDVALQAFFPGAKASHFRGNFAYHPDFPGKKFYPIYHPSYMFHRADKLPLFQQQLERLGRVMRNEDVLESITIVQGKPAFDELTACLEKPVVSLDVEATTADVWKPDFRIRRFGVSTDGKTVVTIHESDPFFVAAMEQVRTFLEDENKGVIGSHVAFDVEAFERELEFRARIQAVHDVQIIWYEAAQYQMSSLKQLVSEQLDGYRCLIHFPWAEKSGEHELTYMAEDIAYAYRLFIKGMQKLSSTTRDLVTRSIGPMSLIYHRAQAHGLYIRPEYRQQKIEEYQDRRRAAVTAWKDADPEFIPKEHESGNGLMRYLFNVRKLPVLGYTDGGTPVTDQYAVKEWIRAGAGYLQHLLTIREIDKILGTYLKAYDKHVDFGQRIHPNHWLTSTDTSRPSSTDPNVYNIPRVNEIRDMFGVPRGMLLGESDLSQIEFRIAVCLAKDETGIEAYNRGEDAHTATARMITGNPTPTKKQRDDSKPVNFGNIYGAHWKTAQAQALNDYGVMWTDEEAERFQQMFFQTYKRLPAWHQNSRTKLVQNRGWFQSVTGHNFHYRNWDHPDQAVRDHEFRSALNAEAQGPAANICYYIAVLSDQLLQERGFKEVICVNSVYDSIMTEIPDPKWRDPVFHTINDAVKMAYSWVKPWFVVPLIMEHAYGESWGSLKKWAA